MTSYLIITDTDNLYQAVATILSLQLHPQHPDQFHLDTSGVIPINSVRRLQSFLQTPPLEHRQKIVVVSAAERLSLPAQHALLKTLEEPPLYARIILSTSTPHLLLPTIHSRCIVNRYHQNLEQPTEDQLYLPLLQATTTDKIRLAQANAKSTESAQEYLRTLISQISRSLHNEPSRITANHLQLAHQTLREITTLNLNPQHAMEQLLFSI